MLSSSKIHSEVNDNQTSAGSNSSLEGLTAEQLMKLLQDKGLTITPIQSPANPQTIAANNTIAVPVPTTTPSNSSQVQNAVTAETIPATLFSPNITQENFLLFCREGNYNAVVNAVNSNFDPFYEIYHEHSRTVLYSRNDRSISKIESKFVNRTIIETPLSAAMLAGVNGSNTAIDIAKFLIQKAQQRVKEDPNCKPKVFNRIVSYPHAYYESNDAVDTSAICTNPLYATKENFESANCRNCVIFHTEFSLALELEMYDLAEMLLKAGASAWHQPYGKRGEVVSYWSTLHIAVYKKAPLKLLAEIVNNLREEFKVDDPDFDGDMNVVSGQMYHVSHDGFDLANKPCLLCLIDPFLLWLPSHIYVFALLSQPPYSSCTPIDLANACEDESYKGEALKILSPTPNQAPTSAPVEKNTQLTQVKYTLHSSPNEDSTPDLENKYAATMDRTV